MKKLLLIFFAIIVCAKMTFAESGTCGTNVTWTLTDSVLTISGSGAMTNYESRSDQPWYSSCQAINKVVITQGVTSIGKYVFAYCGNITSVTIPNSVKSIGAYAFWCCSKLSKITIPNSVTSIDVVAFSSSGLKSITIPNSITEIKKSTFSSCSSLSSVSIPNTVTIIGQNAFGDCSNLATVTIPNSVTTIRDAAFHNCTKLKTLTIGSSVTNIGTTSFAYCILTSITCYAAIPPTLGEASWGNGNNTFYNVSNPSGKSLYVPSASVSAYKKAATWERFNVQALPTYTITWKQDDGSTINQTTVEQGTMPTHANPTKTATAEYIYTFAGWTPTIVAATANATYTATYTATKRKYTITFNNYDNTQLQSSSVEYGKVPAYTNGTPTKPATAEYTFTFKGWSPEVVAVTGDATYTAQFDSVKNVYQVTWLNADGSELGKDSLEYGTMPTHDDLVKANTAEYTYTFKGWTPDTVAVTGDATYIAVFDSVKNVYQITWLNADGSELGKDSLEYGEMPEYKGEAPTKDSTTVYAYSFAGWTPNIATVTGDATYTAKFDSTKIEYNVDITIPDTIESHGSVTIDGEPTYGDTITITATPDDGYYFDGWSDGNTDNPREIEITGDTAVYPIFKECEEIIVNISQTINKGQSFTFGGQELTTRGTYRDTVVLANGCDSIVVLKLNVLNSKVKFNLRVVVNDETMGTVSGTGAYVSGSEVTITATPASSKYIFVRWYNEDENIDVYENPYTFTLTRNLQLRAVFRKAPRKTPKANNKNK